LCLSLDGISKSSFLIFFIFFTNFFCHNDTIELNGDEIELLLLSSLFGETTHK
jgi:hypothetical protein